MKQRLTKLQAKLFSFCGLRIRYIMITKIIDDSSISVMPEDSDDLLNLRRIIKENDKVIGDTTRVLKQDKDYCKTG